MDAFEAAKVVVDRIKELEPRAARCTTRYMLLTHIPGQELIRLALGPDASIFNLIQKLHNSSLFISDPFSSSSPPNSTYYDGRNNSIMMSIIRGSRNGVDQSCRYFNRGFCKHGSKCRYYHRGEYYSFSGGGDGDEFDQGALKKLELEVVHLLKSQKGCPVSIASLPMLYYDKYGRSLQAEGYLSESQRHGKAGYSLTKLLARLDAIRLIDRPHGQHAVVLAEDALKYMDIHSEKNEYDTSGLRQIYLTFPPESTFSEEDVSNYFSKFGAVEDVRIPWQERRMFGFVTFASANTVKWILSKGCPHYVCGARVLAKPYQEKSKLAQRKYLEKFESYPYHPIDHVNSRVQSRPYSEEEHENDLKREMWRFSQLQLATPSCINDEDYKSVQELNLPDSPFKSP